MEFAGEWEKHHFNFIISFIFHVGDGWVMLIINLSPDSKKNKGKYNLSRCFLFAFGKIGANDTGREQKGRRAFVQLDLD